LAVDEQRTHSAANGDVGHQSADVDDGRRHLAGLVTDVVGVPGTQRARTVGAPAAQAAAVEDHAGVVTAGHDLGDAEAADGDVRGRHLAELVADVDLVGVALAERARPGASPAAHQAGVEQHAGVRAAGRDLHGGTTEVEVGRRHLAALITQAVGAAVAELSAPARAPAADLAVAEQRTGVRDTGGELGDRGADAGDGDVGGRHLVEAVADVVDVPVAELAVHPVAPAADLAVAHQRAVVLAAADDLHGRTAEIGGRRRHLAGVVAQILVGPVAQASVALVAPTAGDPGREHGAGTVLGVRHGQHARAGAVGLAAVACDLVAVVAGR